MMRRFSDILCELRVSTNNSATLSKYLPFFALFALFILFTAINPRFASLQNVENILKQGATLFIVTTGTTYIILMGSIDLSMGGLVSLTGITSVLLANSLSNAPFAGLISILGAVLVGLCVGTLIGVVFALFRLPSFLVSFGFSTICTGLGLMISGGRSIPTYSQPFIAIGTGSTLFIPNLGIVAIAILALGIFLGRKTIFGRNIYAIGGEERVAELCGIPVTRYKIYAFMFAGAMTGLGGGLMSSRIGACTNRMGSGMALDAIAAVVMGGTALTGGKGGVARTIIGVLIIIFLSNGLNVLGVPTYTQVVIKGIVVILAVAATIDRAQLGIVK